ncbi:hypothetical protein [uncultured Cohaesibacter sp.]|uniref:hypothetical protein n=1 Tax=uncultured Cohaesibacter sp. TaxID=1002546 RepID=UPI00292F184B|nr:hypothetical protein [uncultured Cohaesibacter sp.]
MLIISGMEFGGAVDLVVYSLATGVRPDSETGSMIRSVIKPVGESFCGYSVNLETDGLEAACIEPATDQEIADTVAVMGGGDWQDWILFLKGEGLLAKGCQTVAYSYLGPDLTRPIYTDGTLGRAQTGFAPDC